MKVGVAGLGAMGRGMARNLAAAGLLVGVWNRTRANGEPLADELQVPLAEDATALARQCDVVITCVSADQDVLEVVGALADGVSEGDIVIDTSTIGVDTAEAAAELLRVQGAAFLDAPVTGGSEGAEAGTLQVMVGGDPDVLERVRPALAAIGSDATHFGPVGYGQRAKAVNQVMVAGIVQAISESLSFAEASGLDTERLLPVLTGGAAGSRLLERRGSRILAGDFEPGFRVALHHKDLNLCRDLLRKLDVNLPLVEMTLKHYDRLLEQGYGDEDTSALFRLKREMFQSGNRKSL
ncbi:NAD(P)-dependent oxidoreductase [Spiribacter vilamensis]|uniref:3-hydroxyisobutyrate dehydrogenase n=2 Tax=Spiribacter vilamensis TaxID=531306 RepID=A0A4Q8D1S3_9GAMM|nr:NAD(P)-dependent oxidoreductase [Spiribacter vilamensis]RZU99298.1 3-hydroxyisobutyrate dehydrogenase [Spiribacter vilamensis]TVO61718.1 NAD(P)-dependent oxidoreductase [Spiribacter vilamensis]